MSARVVEVIVSAGRRRAERRIRIDLHGISTFGPGPHHSLIRWEQLASLSAGPHGVTASSSRAEIILPNGIFGVEPAALASKLEQARSIFQRSDILAELSGAESNP
jgi:hypothetical protein